MVTFHFLETSRYTIQCSFVIGSISMTAPLIKEFLDKLLNLNAVCNTYSTYLPTWPGNGKASMPSSYICSKELIFRCNRNSNVIIVSLTKLMRSSIYFVVEYNRMKITSSTSSMFSIALRFFKLEKTYTTVCKIVTVKVTRFFIVD